MKLRRLFKLFAIVLLAVLAVIPVHAYAEEGEYDKINTLLALNMAIVSVNTIVSTNDRIVLDQEYDNIINKFLVDESPST